ncbi:hypothetical protein PV708_39225 [Streptomyces sp. ME02-6977A]|nr:MULTISPECIES: hypothetical protein [unclassified Streptomyces]MDX3345940.1 hypothetical protein [Streptomyces sp. ME02-6979A]MDX3412200.1 hypothetical protein [Streptomyces sp. ME02-6977A]MDX3421706.1 hypothetical protein [Streptomyces sp. ME02-6985-2c]
MVVDLTKTPSPEQPDPAEPLTAREEVMVPLRALVAAVATGSPVVARMIGHGIRSALRTALQSPRPTPPPPSAEQGEEDDAVAKAPAAKESIGDLLERLALGVLTIGVACTALSGVLTVAWKFLTPYAGWGALGLAVAWCATAAHLAPAPDTTENDHEMWAGEQPREDDTEEDPEDDGEVKEARWAAAQESLLVLVEQRAAAIAGRHVEGIKGRGVPVDYLLAELQKKGILPGVGRKGVIELLEMAGITVRDQMSFSMLEDTPTGLKWKKKTPPGVHVDDLAEALGRAPRLPAHLVPDLTPGAPPVPAPETGPE